MSVAKDLKSSENWKSQFAVSKFAHVLVNGPLDFALR